MIVRGSLFHGSHLCFSLVLFFRMAGPSKPVQSGGVSKKIITCDSCSFQSFGEDEMQEHVERCHMSRCLVCGQQFDDNGTYQLLKVHIQNVHGEPTCCLVCGEEERQPSNFKQHFECRHPWEVYSPSKFSKKTA